MSPDLFESHLKFIVDHCSPIPIAAVAAALTKGAPLPENPIALTFDDGYIDNYQYAFPLLIKYRVPATIYVVSDFIDGRIQMISAAGWGPLSWQQMREMEGTQLVLIGAHTCTHRILSTLNDAQAREEVRSSKLAIERNLGHPIESFAYPNGRGRDIPRAAVDEVHKLGFSSACSTIWGTRHAPESLYWLSQLMISHDDSVETLEWKISGRYDYLNIVHRADSLFAGRVRNIGLDARD